MKDRRGIEELLSDMLIRQDRLIEALKTNTMILKELADGQKNMTNVQKDLLKEHQNSIRGQKAIKDHQKHLETRFDELYKFLRENIGDSK